MTVAITVWKDELVIAAHMNASAGVRKSIVGVRLLGPVGEERPYLLSLSMGIWVDAVSFAPLLYLDG